jgi:hypothetical protein
MDHPSNVHAATALGYIDIARDMSTGERSFASLVLMRYARMGFEIDRKGVSCPLFVSKVYRGCRL